MEDYNDAFINPCSIDWSKVIEEEDLSNTHFRFV